MFKRKKHLQENCNLAIGRGMINDEELQHVQDLARVMS